MEVKHEEEMASEPVSPTGQYFNSSVLSISVIGVLEIAIPIDDSQTMTLLRDVFLPINPRFSSLMVRDEYGVKKWKRVEVKLKDHVHVPVFPPGKSKEFYDEFLGDYMTKISMEPFPQTRPLWEVHVVKYPTSNAAGTVFFKLHHALGDGFSLMGALLSCLQRAEDPSLPLTFPKFQAEGGGDPIGFRKRMSGVLSAVVNTVSDFGWSLLKSGLIEDERTPVRSGDEGVEFRPVTLTTITYSLDDIKQIKSNLGVTINDVICGIIFLGTRLYMQAASHELRNASSTALVLLNTRNIVGYKSVKEMVEPNAESPWGNQFGFLHVPIPNLNQSKSLDPLGFVFMAQRLIKRKRNSSAVFLTGQLLEALRKWRGPEATASYMHSTLKNSSMTISNLIGPQEQMSLSNHPIKGLHFMVFGIPQSLTITMMSYMRNLRIAVGTEEGFIDAPKFKSSIDDAFHLVFKAAQLK